MFSTPLICCSSGASTVSETISAEAPGYVTATLIVGGAICGNCATGRSGYENAPTSVITIAITVAKIGRSTKKCARRMGEKASLRDRRSQRRRRRSARVGGGDLGLDADGHDRYGRAVGTGRLEPREHDRDALS